MFLTFAWISVFFALLVDCDVVPSDLIPTRLLMNSGWSRMPYNVTVSPWIPNVYKLEALVPLRVAFSDAYCPGDMVSLYVNGTFLKNSTSVPAFSDNCKPGLNLPDGTAAYPELYSRAEFWVPAGNHSIALKSIQTAEGLSAGAMYIKAELPLRSDCGGGNGPNGEGLIEGIQLLGERFDL